MSDPQASERQTKMSDRTVVVLLTEAAALLIAVLSTLVPGRTGSTWSPADLFNDDPGFLARVAASFLLLNVVFALLGLGSWFFVFRRRHGSVTSRHEGPTKR